MTRPEDELNLAEACVHGNISFKTVYRLAAAKKLTLLKRAGDRRTYVSRRELEAALALMPTASSRESAASA